MKLNKYDFILHSIPAVLFILIAIVYAVLGFMIPPIGDDLGFIESFSSQNDCWYAFPRYVYRAWLWNNARMADMLNPLGYIFIPAWLQAVSNGIVVGLMYYIAVRFSTGSQTKSPFFAVLVIFLLTFLMRWDGIWMEYNTFYNYIWSSAFVMLALGFLFSGYSNKGKWYCWLILPLCFISCAMHEAVGVPVAISLVLFSMVTPFFKDADILRKLTVVAMIAGGLFTLTSPASYLRIGSMLQPESPVSIIGGSAIFVVFLILLSLYMLIFHKEMLYSLIRSEWIVFAGIALLSSGFMLLSGFGGRTGWFAQIFAIIAVFQVVKKLDISVGKSVGWVCSILFACLIVLHLWQLVAWQYRLSQETRDVISKYEKSEDGIVYYDYTSDLDIPWYLFRKNHGVPDDDDTYYRYRMRKHYGAGKQLVILPTAFYPIPDSLSKPVRHGRFILAAEYPQDTFGDTIVEIFPRELSVVDGKQYIINKFDYEDRQLYLLSQMDRDRGEK